MAGITSAEVGTAARPAPAAAPAAAAPAAPSAPRLAAVGISKRYGERKALDGVTLELAAGQWTALLGPNGAGKTTLFALLSGLFAADAGRVSIAGQSLERTPARALRELGVVFQQSALDLDLSVLHNLRLHAALHGLPRACASARIEAALGRFGLLADRHRAARELSGGNRRKVELARALLHRPAVLLMDEPTVGLDPRSREELLVAVREDVCERASAVLWATHLVDEAERADRVLVLHRGRLLADGTPGEVRAALGAVTLEEAFLRATREPQR
jgi:ABC-2 type transport system ATP-binding protein